ncbi:MAG: hypothetical protein V1743_04235, partial [Nanoarchaeota archaeon]
MIEYTIFFHERNATILDIKANQPQAVVNLPDLPQEVELPVRYAVEKPDGKLFGAVVSYVPERKRILMRNDAELSTLIIGANDELFLQTGNRRYDISQVKLEDLVEEEAQQHAEAGFTHGYKLRSSDEVGSLSFFQKDTQTRAILKLDTSSYLPFLPIVLYDRIRQDIEGKTLKKSIPVVKGLKLTRKPQEDGPFVKFVKERFQPNFIDEAFPYQDQAGEKERFFEYLDHGLRPVILNGPTGNGKSVLSRFYASSRELPYYFDTGSMSFRISTAIGKFVPSPGSPIFSPGALTMAAIFGGV